MSGYESSAVKLATLPAAYSMYGSADGWRRSVVSHCWSIGLLVESRKNGMPTDVTKAPNSQRIGLPTVGIASTESVIGMVAIERSHSAAWTAACIRGLSHLVVA